MGRGDERVYERVAHRAALRAGGDMRVPLAWIAQVWMRWVLPRWVKAIYVDDRCEPKLNPKP